MSARRLWVLINALPPDSALVRQGRLWTQTHELLASIYERQEHWGSYLVQMSGRALKDGAQGPEVMRFSHPDRELSDPQDTKPKVATRADLARMFAGG